MLSDVNTALSGFALVNNGLLFIKDRNCIIRKEEWSPNRKVKLIAGGGIGHGPAFYEYVGKGMLDGAVCGEGFSPPSATSIVDCLRVVAKRNKSVLFIVNNNLQDRLHFGLAIERARMQYGYENLKMLVSDDDYAIEEYMLKTSGGRRGLVGCVVLIKILGAMAESGHSLEEVYDFGFGLLWERFLATVSATFDEIDEHLENIELGKGIHGDRCVDVLRDCGNFNPFRQFTRERLVEKLKFRKSAQLVLFVNNFGGVSESSMNRLTDSLAELFRQEGVVRRVYVGNFLTAMKPSGVSLTLVNSDYDKRLMEYLDFKVEVASSLFDGASLHNMRPSEVKNFEQQLDSRVPQAVQKYELRFDDSTKRRIWHILKEIANELACFESAVNEAGNECRVGNVGKNMMEGAKVLFDSSEKLGFPYPANMLQSIGLILEREIDGIFGIIYGLFFQTASKVFAGAHKSPHITTQLWLDALTQGNKAIALYTRYVTSGRNMLFALKQAEKELRIAHKENATPSIFAQTFATACNEAAITTIEMPQDSELAHDLPFFRHKEPGAFVVSLWADALNKGLSEELPESD